MEEIKVNNTYENLEWQRPSLTMTCRHDEIQLVSLVTSEACAVSGETPPRVPLRPEPCVRLLAPRPISLLRHWPGAVTTSYTGQFMCHESVDVRLRL